MKAIVHERYGTPDVLRCEELDKPTPREGEVLVKVRAASINPLDWRLMRGKPYLLRLLVGRGEGRLKRPGRDVAGQVEAVAPDVTRFKAGDEVFGACPGAFAEYACASESKLVMKPEHVSFEQAAAVPVAGLAALQGLRDWGRLRPGQRVLINGASGGVGTFAVQIARSLGAEVTAVCSTRNLGLVRSIGADRVIDYTRDDFTEGASPYDLILDTISNHSPSRCRRVLQPNGVCVIAGGGGVWSVLAHIVKARMLSLTVSQSFVPLTARITKEDLAVLAELMKTGKVTPVVDRRYPLADVAQAMRYAEGGHARGKIVISA